MGIGYIPASKIRQYGIDELGLVDDDNDWFFAIVRQMDDEYVKLSNATKTKTSLEVPIDDVDGVKSLFSDLEAHPKKLSKKPHPKK